MKKPVVSVIVPTKNSSKTLKLCLLSIKNQTFKNFEIILVDNNSSDDTRELAKKFTKKVFNKGPERSSQRNFGAKKAIGKYLLFLDSDMTLDKNAILESVKILDKNSNIGALIIPERSVGKSYWGKCKALEKGFYEGVSWIEAARVYRASTFNKIGGFDATLISGEDWDLSHRASKASEVSRIKSFVTHYEGDVSLLDLVRKKYYYSIHISKYITKSSGNLNIMVFDRYKLFFSKPKKLFRNPALGFGLLFIKTSEFGAGFIGYMVGRFNK